MKINSRTGYAVKALLELLSIVRKGKIVKPVTLESIATATKISLSYLEQIFGKLGKAKIVTSTRGPGGGYLLANYSSKITVFDIMMAVDNGEYEVPQWLDPSNTLVGNMKETTLEALYLFQNKEIVK